MDLVPSAAYESLMDPGGGVAARGRSQSGDRVVILPKRNSQEQVSESVTPDISALVPSALPHPPPLPFTFYTKKMPK